VISYRTRSFMIHHARTVCPGLTGTRTGCC
jgi:hypothetical protein